MLRKKQKDRAKLYLKQSKLFREQSKVADTQLQMINEQIMNIESASTMKEIMDCLNQGNSVLKNLQKEVSIEHWDNIRDDMDELKERDREISDFFKERGIDEEEYEAECEDELNKLLYEIQGNNELDLQQQVGIEGTIKLSGKSGDVEITYHHALKYLLNKPQVVGREWTRLLWFQEFDFEVVLRPKK